jgi:chemotaxis signal transduction protein
MTSEGILLVRAGGRQVGIPLREVLEVGDLGAITAVPSTLPAMRGVILARGRLVTLLHLGTLLSGNTTPPASTASTVVLVQSGDTPVALEVEEADTVPGAAILPPPEGSEFAASAVGAMWHNQRWIPILNLEALMAPWRSREAGV